MFQVSILHNLFHLLFGVVGLVLARTAEGAGMYLTGGGIVYLALWVLGAVGVAGWLPANTADNWLHFLVGIGLLGLGFVAGHGRAPRPSSPSASRLSGAPPAPRQ